LELFFFFLSNLQLFFIFTQVWIDGTGENVRCKDRVLEKTVQKASDCPDWQYDGSSTYQAQGGNSDVTLVPRALYRDPFKAGDKDVIVLCDTYKPDGSPCDSNHRAAMQSAYDQTQGEEPWFGIEQVRTGKNRRGKVKLIKRFVYRNTHSSTLTVVH
jgi:glutamine synthetase